MPAGRRRGRPSCGVAAMSDDLCMMPAAELVARYRAGSLSPVEVTEAALGRAEQVRDAVNAFVLLCPQDALVQARDSEARWRRDEPAGLLDGVPTTIKDLALMAGYPTRRGSRTSPEAPAKEDSPTTQRLREHGAVFIGKTTTPEFGWKGVTDSPLTGITRNPWDPTRTAGGSSGGACASVALGAGAIAMGGDGGGSIRMPSSFCGVFGLKPTVGRVPTWPKGGVGSCSTHGPMTRTVTDAALAMRVIARPDARDWYAMTDAPPDYLDGLEDGVEDLRVAYSPDLGYAAVDPPVAATVAKAASAFAALGARVEEVGAFLENPRQAFESYFAVGMAAGYRLVPAEKRSLLDPGYAAMAEHGLGVDLYAYKDLEGAREATGTAVNRLFERFDLLLTPQTSLVAFAAGCDFPAGRAMVHWMDWSPFTYPFNFSGHPAASVPCGFDPDGLPVGLQIVGQRQHDALVLRAARAYERAHPFAMPALANRAGLG